jgi:small GTP-binding protein
LKRFAKNEFDSKFNSTVGIDFEIKSINVDGKIIQLQIWDTAGQERFSELIVSYYRGADGVFFVYDITNSKSFDSIDRWIRNFEEVIIF